MLLRRSVSILNARLKDVQILLRIEEFALVMAPRGRLVAMKDVQILLRKEEFAFVMARHGKRGLAAMKDAQMLL